MILADSEEYLQQMLENKEVVHLNGDKADNGLSSLMYMTATDRVMHSYIVGRRTYKPVEERIDEYTVWAILKSHFQLRKNVEKIAEEFIVSKNDVKKVIEGKIHSDVRKKYKRVHGIQRSSIVNDNEVLEMIDLFYSQKLTQPELAERYGISRSYVAMIVSGHRKTNARHTNRMTIN